MQEFTSRKESSPAPPAGHWPSDEDLAAYIDGTLGKAESQRITEHLADCEDCYAVYAETLQFQLETEVPEEGNVVVFPSKKDVERRRWIGIAALLALGVGIGATCYALLAPPPNLVTAEVTAPIQGKPELTGSLWLGPTYRGGGDEGEEAPPPDPASFQMGVQLVNLQVSLEAGDGKQASDVVTRIYNILENQLFVEDLKKDYLNITAAIENGTPPNDLAGKASALAQQAREVFNAPHLDFGQWVEAGRLAAAAGEPSFFEHGDTRTFLRRLLWRQKLGIGEMKLDPAARRSLQDISEVVSRGSLGRAEYGKLRKDLETILDVYYPQS
jgi:putative zinc finger protein